MSTPRDSETIRDLLACCHLIQSWTDGVEFKDFAKSDMMKSAILHEVIIIGEATTRLSAEFKELHKEIDWREIKDMRNHLVHHYDTIIIERVWETVQHDIPELVQQIERLLLPPNH
jgi:uncharacterized protein with HEPN domain